MSAEPDGVLVENVNHDGPLRDAGCNDAHEVGTADDENWREHCAQELFQLSRKQRVPADPDERANPSPLPGFSQLQCRTIAVKLRGPDDARALIRMDASRHVIAPGFKRRSKHSKHLVIGTRTTAPSGKVSYKRVPVVPLIMHNLVCPVESTHGERWIYCPEPDCINPLHAQYAQAGSAPIYVPCKADTESEPACSGENAAVAANAAPRPRKAAAEAERERERARQDVAYNATLAADAAKARSDAERERAHPPPGPARRELLARRFECSTDQQSAERAEAGRAEAESAEAETCLACLEPLALRSGDSWRCKKAKCKGAYCSTCTDGASFTCTAQGRKQEVLDTYCGGRYERDTWVKCPNCRESASFVSELVKRSHVVTRSPRARFVHLR